MNRTKLAERAARIQELCGEINARETELARLTRMTTTMGRRAATQPADPQRLHWSQTPEGRATLSKAQKKRYRAQRAAAAPASANQ